MDRKILKNWFHKHFVPEVQAFLKERGFPQKAVLLLDNAPSRLTESVLTSNDGLIVVKFLIQPMDQLCPQNDTTRLTFSEFLLVKTTA
jgi:hypothetical protein